MGAGSIWIIVKHLFPNALSPIITNMAFAIPSAIFAESFLSYIGLGLPLPTASWGVFSIRRGKQTIKLSISVIVPGTSDLHYNVML